MRAMAMLRFATFELDEDTGELRKRGRLVHLAAQPARLLVLLAQRPGQVVTRDEVVARLWGADTFVAFDQGLSFCLSRVRLALGDNARAPRFVETVPRSGYRFLAPVERVGPAVAPPAARPRAHGGGRAFRIAAGIAMLLFAVERGPALRAHSRTTALPEARAAFERGLRLTSGTPEDRRRSIYAFRAAVGADPLFAEAHYALADVYLSLGELGQVAPGAALPEARRAAETALSLEDAPGTRLVLASVRSFHDWDWSGARRDLDAALRSAPDSDAVLTSYARYLSAIGADDEAVRTIDRAEARTPACDLVSWESGGIRFRARRYDEAIRKFEQAIALGPPRGRDPAEWRKANLMTIFRVHVRRGAWKAAARDATVLLEASGTSPEGLRAFAALEPREAADRFLAGCVRFMTARAEKEYVPGVELAQLHALRGEAGAALDRLERAANEREPSVAWSLRNPDFDGLRGDPRFAALVARMGLTDACRNRDGSPGSL
jgi:DNA-binding winged helix-turn-helix (wHTH) protein/tetratricopeptide (TPR) repeat protein